MTRVGSLRIMLLAAAAACAISALAAASTHSPQQQSTILQEGHDAFDKGASLLDTDPASAREAFLRAADRWTLLIDDGVVNGPLLYDLGNAWVQAGDLGRGIAAYLRSEHFMPADARLAGNLAHARSLVSPQFGADSTQALAAQLTAWHGSWSLWTRLGLFTAGWCLLWAVLLARRFADVAVWRWLAGAGLAVSLVFGISVGIQILGPDASIGVLTHDDVVVRKGDAESYQPAFDEPINRGVEFRILESRPVWLHVEFPNGANGWIPADTAVRV
jgi:hypothetical protein